MNAQIQMHTAPRGFRFPTMAGGGRERTSADRKSYQVWFKEIFGARKTHGGLAQLSDHSLTDIGLTRDQVQIYIASRNL